YTIVGSAVNTASRLESLATPGEILISYETFAHVRSETHCEERGEIEVKGIAYPLSTYRVVDSHANLQRKRQRFREEHHNALVDLDLDAMTTKDRRHVEDILQRAISLLRGGDEIGEVGQSADTGSG
ncbi:MAG: adenylate/guanylate cyclase domain-containing protein, partial [Paracoccaceae bacterium]